MFVFYVNVFGACAGGGNVHCTVFFDFFKPKTKEKLITIVFPYICIYLEFFGKQKYLKIPEFSGGHHYFKMYTFSIDVLLIKR